MGATSGSWTLGSYNTLAYTKIGRVVHVQGYVDVVGESSPVGNVEISLPFAVASLSDDAETAAVAISMRSHGGSDLYNISGSVNDNATIRLIAVDGSGTANWLDAADIGAGWNIRIGGSYIAA